MANERLLKAAELPPGSRMFPRQGAALTGQEIGEATIRVVTRMLEDEGTSMPEIDRVVDALDEQMARGWWRAQHLTFPRAQMHFEVGVGELGTSVFVAIELGVSRSATSLVKLCVGSRLPGQSARTIQLGPSRIPDQMREELGLPLTAHFRLPDGSVVLAELADPREQEEAQGGWFKGPNHHIPQATPAPAKSAEPALVAPDSLVGTPPPAQTPQPAPQPPPKQAPKLVAGKGGRR